MNITKNNFIKSIECYRSDHLGLNIYIAKVVFSKPVEVVELKSVIENLVSDDTKSIGVGIPSNYDISPCSILQAYLYYKEDLHLTKKPRIRNPALHILSYIFMETQIFKITENIANFRGVYIISLKELERLCEYREYKSVACEINELSRITGYRVQNML